MSSSDFQGILNLLPEGVIEIDSAQRIQYSNPAACTLLKIEQAAIQNAVFSDLFDPVLGLRLSSRIRSSITSAAPVSETIRIHNQVLRLRVNPRPNGEGAVMVLEDLTGEIQRVEEVYQQNVQLQKAKQELERRLSALQIIRNLPTSIRYPYGYSEILEAISRLAPQVVDIDTTAVMIESTDSLILHLFSKENIGQQNINRIQNELLESFNRSTQQNKDSSHIAHELNGCVVVPESQPFQSSLFFPIKQQDKICGIAACYSKAPSCFSFYDEEVLSLFFHLTFQSALNMKEVIDTERKRIQAMVESMVDGVLMTDENDEVVVMNQAAKKILRVSRKDDSITKKYFQETLGFYPFRLTKGLVRKSGLQATIKEEVKVFEKTLHSVVSPVYDLDGMQTGTVIVLRDITEEKQLEERKNDFLSVISHELRTPLASIGGSIDLVLDHVVGQINEKQRRYLELAKDSCQKLNVVIDDLLDISKFEKGRMEIQLELISLIRLVEEVAEKFQAYAMEKEITIHLEKPAHETKVYGDYNRLVQVMNNLLSNAIKFTPRQGEILIRVFLPKVMSPHIGVSVKDTGPGIRAEDLERVFDKFEQVRRSDTRKIGGTGLGLAISRSIIESHKGKIWAESKPGEGAKFIFLLPVEKRSTFAPEVFAELAEQAASQELSAVVIAGEADSAYLLKGILHERGFKVTLSYNAQEGYNLVQQSPPHLILIDLDLDPSSGMQLIDILNQDAETSSIPVIGLSRNPVESILPFANVILIQKPIEMNQLLHAISTSLNRIQGADQRKKILLVDDDPNLRMIAREALQYQNYAVLEASDGNQALEILKHHRPELILLDVMLPGIDGLRIAQIVRSNISTSLIPIIFLTAKGQTEDKVKALKAGGSDYIVKPFDSTELAARIEAILERMEKELSASPTTKLPGSVAIEKEINHLIQQHQKFALCYLDLDNLKSYNDVYGYAQADIVVKQTGEIIRETVLKLGHPTDFVGHIAGDDFVFITHPDHADKLCLNIMERFDQIIPYFYKPEDRQRGYIEAEDRYGVLRQTPILSVSVVCLTNEEHQLTDHFQIAALAAEYKRMAKMIPTSCYIRNGKRIETALPSE